MAIEKDGHLIVTLDDGTVVDFEMFARPERGIRNGLCHLTLTDRGLGYLNAAAYAMLGSPDYIRLGYSAGRRLIGIHPSTSVERASYRLRRANGSGWTFSLVAFCNYYDIPRDATRTFTGQMEGDYLAFPLDTAVISQRARKRC